MKVFTRIRVVVTNNEILEKGLQFFFTWRRAFNFFSSGEGPVIFFYFLRPQIINGLPLRVQAHAIPTNLGINIFREPHMDVLGRITSIPDTCK